MIVEGYFFAPSFETRGLGNVVEEAAVGKGLRGGSKMTKQPQGVGKDVPLGVILRTLLDTL